MPQYEMKSISDNEYRIIDPDGRTVISDVSKFQAMQILLELNRAYSAGMNFGISYIK